jgi:integrase
VKRLERGERPSPRRGDQRILNGAEIAKLLDHATTPAYRTLLAVGISTGLRQSELLGLQYADLDLAGGVVRVRAQL